MRVDLTGKVALVTGGANGIGRAIVRMLAQNGATVAIVDREGVRAEVVAAEERSVGHRCLALAGDVTDAARMEAVCRQVIGEVGALHILINNAGINTAKNRVTIEQYAPEDWQQIVGVDLTGLYNVSRAALPHLLKQGGRIVNISSIAGVQPLRLQCGFVAAKSAVAALTRAMAMEYGGQGVLVNCVAPGSTLTRGTEALFYGPDGTYNTQAASLLSHIPLGRPGTPEEIAGAVLYLVSPIAGYVNGQVICVDGGWTAGSMEG